MGLGVTIQGSRVTWSDPKYGQEDLTFDRGVICLNVNRLKVVDANSATWDHQGTLTLWMRDNHAGLVVGRFVSLMGPG